MRNLAIAIAAGALIASAVPAFAEDAPAPRARSDSAAEQRAGDDNPDRRICVSVELTGSRMVRRVCRTAREWDERGGLEPAQ